MRPGPRKWRSFNPGIPCTPWRARTGRASRPLPRGTASTRAPSLNWGRLYSSPECCCTKARWKRRAFFITRKIPGAGGAPPPRGGEPLLGGMRLLDICGWNTKARICTAMVLPAGNEPRFFPGA
ncbi:hypothetical protein KL86DPRO_20237 [uncultured delta proteobacterium]|uniref:Uncharacterized protein n=1 Tax=uncultured delta proteobacterium TaxID=34034 RepID=A0A212JX18_9DELT|nr:hypothetical protein KL86DPRO_20237 [uncultured delta proteobacterium]